MFWGRPGDHPRRRAGNGARAMTYCPVVTTACADCGVGTITLGEWYMVNDEIWQSAWAGRRKPWTHLPGQEILCIGCLEKRIGRTLMACDFTDAPVNDVNDGDYRSDRLFNRLTATEGRVFDLFEYLAKRISPTCRLRSSANCVSAGNTWTTERRSARHDHRHRSTAYSLTI
jgi:hypothetical protein